MRSNPMRWTMKVVYAEVRSTQDNLVSYHIIEPISYRELYIATTSYQVVNSIAGFPRFFRSVEIIRFFGLPVVIRYDTIREKPKRQ